MLSRIRKKLYLQSKVMGSMQNTTQTEVDGDSLADSKDEQPQKLAQGELIAIHRGGAGAIAKWGEDGVTDPFVEFRAASIEELLTRGKQLDEAKEIEVQVEVGENIDPAARRQMELDAEEEEERLLLAGKEVVKSREFEGRTYHRSNIDIRDDRSSLERTDRNDRWPCSRQGVGRLQSLDCRSNHHFEPRGAQEAFQPEASSRGPQPPGLLHLLQGRRDSVRVRKLSSDRSRQMLGLQDLGAQ